MISVARVYYLHVLFRLPAKTSISELLCNRQLLKIYMFPFIRAAISVHVVDLDRVRGAFMTVTSSHVHSFQLCTIHRLPH
jgi:hypothetical protein